MGTEFLGVIAVTNQPILSDSTAAADQTMVVMSVHMWVDKNHGYYLAAM